MDESDAIIRVADITKPLACAALYDRTRPLEVEVGCGKGRFLTGRAAQHPETEFLGIERMPERVHAFARKCARANLTHAHVVRLEALYTFWYMLPAHGVDVVYVFFPDPWPKKKHHSHRLFGPVFLRALWKRLKIGGRIEFATDHEEYFHVVEECFAGAADRFARREPRVRGPEEWTEFETLFRGQGLPIHAAAWEARAGADYELEPMTVAPEDEPQEGIARRESRGKEWREMMHAQGD